MNKITVMIVDDHTLMRETWEHILNTSGKYQVIGSIGNGEVAIEAIKTQRPNVVLLDINSPPIDGFEILKMTRKFSPGTRVIGVSMHSQPAYAKKMLRNGAKGYVTKNSKSKELLEAIEEVLAGRTYLCKEVKDIMATQFIDEETQSPGVNQLSERELEVIQFIREGFSSKEIGSKMNITPKTVEVHRHNILRKLNVKNAASLVQYLNQLGL